MHVEAGEWTEDTQDRAQDDDLTVLRWQMESEMTIEDIRGYVLSWCSLSDYTPAQINYQIGAMLHAQGHPLHTCETVSQRAGWQESAALSAQYDAENYTDNFDAEQLADAEQHVRDVADMQDRQHNYSYFHAV